MHALPAVTHEHHDLLLPHVEELAAIATSELQELAAGMDHEVEPG